ncbi:hypothetical protein [Pseudoclavibacter terrae]|uniref:hypothetical protein n=1 Tax=Pseudoclavibacter terrae TaxID=1530195 RepID=UPI00232FA062|nr:hypothetical protein [Pseudoclavibacter terrae]
MSARVPVFVPPFERDAAGPRDDVLAAYRAAIETLPLSAEAAGGAEGAVVVVDGRATGGWAAGLDAALAAGALGVVVDEVVLLDADADADAVADASAGVGANSGTHMRAGAGAGAPMSAGVASAAGCVPVLVARRFLPRGLADGVGALVGPLTDGARLVTVEVGGAASSGVLRDALGWARVLTGSQLTLTAVRGEPRGATALAESEPGTPVTLSWRRSSGPPWLRVSALGASEVEVIVDAGTGHASGVVRSAHGEQLVGSGYEDRVRGELRRAIEAVRVSELRGDISAELSGVLADLELQRQIEAGLPPQRGGDERLAGHL